MTTYAYIDGDDIGLKIENSFMNNDEEKLTKINNEINSVVYELTKFLTFTGHKIIFSGADGIICKSDQIDSKQIMTFLEQHSPNATFSIGLGSSLRDCFLALRYAKSIGKHAIAYYSGEFSIIQ